MRGIIPHSRCDTENSSTLLLSHTTVTPTCRLQQIPSITSKPLSSYTMASGFAYRIDNPISEVFHFPNYEQPHLPDRREITLLSKGNREPNADPSRFLGHFLPFEIIQHILLYLNLASIGKMLLVDTVSKFQVESVRPYLLLRDKAYETLHLMHRMRLSHYFTIEQLYTEFTHPRCRTCNDFGPYLHLATLTRCCYNCNYHNLMYRMASVKDLCFYFGLKETDLEDIPIVHNTWKSGARLVSVPQGNAIAIILHGPKGSLKITREVHRTIEGLGAAFGEWDLSGPLYRGFGHQRSASVWYENGCEQLQFMATAPFPFWNKDTKTLERGTYCWACYHDWSRAMSSDEHADYPPSRRAYHRSYREADLPEHFLTCAAYKACYQPMRAYPRVLRGDEYEWGDVKNQFWVEYKDPNDDPGWVDFNEDVMPPPWNSNTGTVIWKS
ncbi:hypothetical protein M752DRAFT_313559 [Aspergillus phoenicis ATCC 13157]|uniref:F-box domain-containing protein n=1 Tax=Aspergillus phoenicis ATCC 13157 TaxID=1353007 RepID=A0A370PNC8_ASPPH|nr:hypothetical protein M752DRAFT_313559 [Aspergillus phoenicis ATCC 13157]